LQVTDQYKQTNFLVSEKNMEKQIKFHQVSLNIRNFRSFFHNISPCLVEIHTDIVFIENSSLFVVLSFSSKTAPGANITEQTPEVKLS